MENRQHSAPTFTANFSKESTDFWTSSFSGFVRTKQSSEDHEVLSLAKSTRVNSSASAYHRLCRARRARFGDRRGREYSAHSKSRRQGYTREWGMREGEWERLHLTTIYGCGNSVNRHSLHWWIVRYRCESCVDFVPLTSSGIMRPHKTFL